MSHKTTRVICNSQVQSEAAPDTPLYAIFLDGEWYFVDEEIWIDIALLSDDPQDDEELSS